MSADPTQLRYFVDTNVLGIIATRTHPLRIGYLALFAAEEFDDRTPSISTIVADEVEAGLSTLDAGGSTTQQLAAAMRTVPGAFDHMDLDDKGQTLADKLQIQARAVGHPLGAPSQRNDLIIASLAIRHRAPLISHNYRDFINIDALDLRTMARIRKRPPRVRLEGTVRCTLVPSILRAPRKNMGMVPGRPAECGPEVRWSLARQCCSAARA